MVYSKVRVAWCRCFLSDIYQVINVYILCCRSATSLISGHVWVCLKSNIISRADHRSHAVMRNEVTSIQRVRISHYVDLHARGSQVELKRAQNGHNRGKLESKKSLIPGSTE